MMYLQDLSVTIDQFYIQLFIYVHICYHELE